ncbi:hypothetical protein L7F22_047514 [Adiantum nelumboides]|nr:hypothetical protein [Adiantum nelumboides]
MTDTVTSIPATVSPSATPFPSALPHAEEQERDPRSPSSRPAPTDWQLLDIMLEILGIRTGVEDDEGDSTDEEERLRLQHCG